MTREPPKVGESVKVHLPGESPWADCVATHDDGSWTGKIANRLVNEMSNEEQAQWLGPELWGRLGRRNSAPHNFWEGDFVRFVLHDDLPIWVPSTDHPISPPLPALFTGGMECDQT